MKNKTIVKTGLILALGLAAVGVNSPTVYATSTNVTAPVEKTAKEKHAEKLAEAKEKSIEYNDVLNTIAYKNADESLQNDYILYTNQLKTVISKEEAAIYTSDAEFDAGIYSLDKAINAAEIRKANLNGKVVDKTDLFNLSQQDLEFKSSAAYKNASDEQKNEYDAAITEANRVIGLGNAVTNVEYKEALDNLVAARDSIVKSQTVESTKQSLADEIKLAEELRADKDLYTAESFAKLEKAITAAHTTINTANATLEQYQAQLNALQSAKANLKKIPTTDQAELEEQLARLKEALRKNEIAVESANFLIENTPNTIKNVRYKLDALVVRANAAAAKARVYIAEIEENIKG